MPATRDAFVQALTGYAGGAFENIHFHKEFFVNGTATAAAPASTRVASLWICNGSRPTHGSAPGTTPANPTRATAGALGQSNATGGRRKYITGVQVSQIGTGALLVVDRLAHVSGLNANIGTLQTIGGGGLSVSRYTGAESVGNRIMYEIYAAIGASNRVMTVTYVNQDGDTKTVTTLVGSAAVGNGISRADFLPLAAGDTGVRSVTSVQLSSGTGTAGDFGITIVRPLVAVRPNGVALASTYRNLVFEDVGPVPIEDDACIAFVLAFGSTTGAIDGTVCFAEIDEPAAKNATGKIVGISDLLDLSLPVNDGYSVFCDKRNFRDGSGTGMTLVNGRPCTLWSFYGCPGGQGEYPTNLAAPAVCGRTTAGAWGDVRAVSAGRRRYISSLLLFAVDRAGDTVLWDRLAHCGGVLGNTASLQTFTGGIVPDRFTDGEGNEILVEIGTAIGATPATLTITYTNQDGTGGRTATITVGGTGDQEAQRVMRPQLQAGDTGVRSVQSAQLSGSTSTAGNMVVVIARKIAEAGNGLAATGGPVPIVANGGPIEISDDACIFPTIISASAAANYDYFAEIGYVEK